MYPRTPYPASARRMPRLQNEPQQLAFRDMNSIANTFSKSDQDFLSVLKKAEEEVSSKGTSKASTISRRYSVASKFAGPKPESVSIASGVVAVPGGQLKENKQASFQGTNERQTGSRRKAPSTLSIRSTAAPSLQASHTNASKNQALAAQQANNSSKSSSDSIGREKVSFSRTALTNKSKASLLKTASYWLQQVKLSEAIGKHGVSIGFFRLAVECEAEPVQLLREQLIAYSKRYSLWSETIQQVLLCYGVTNEAQTSSQIPATSLVGSAIPSTDNKIPDGAMTSQKDQASKTNLRCSDEKCASGSLKVSVDAHGANEGSTCLEENLRLDITGDVESMDADTVAQEVVAYIMSSLVHPESSPKLKSETLSEPKASTVMVCSEQNNPAFGALTGGESSTMPLQERITIHSSADIEACSTGSLPSLNAWNVASKEVDSSIACGPIQQDIHYLHDKDSLMKVNGDEMCISMDLDDSVSDNLSELESKIPNSEDAKSNHGNIQTIEPGKAESADGNENTNDIITSCEDGKTIANNHVSGSSCHKAFEPMHAMEKGQSGYKGLENKSVSAKVKTKRSTGSQLQGTTVSECQAKKGSSGKYQNERDKVACVSDKENTDNLVSSRDNATAALSKSRRLSTSTPKLSTSAKVSNVEAGSRTRGKTKSTHALELANASSDISSKCLTAAENNLSTPTHDNTFTGLKQITLDHAGGINGDNLNTTGSTMTPGSAGLRRSARLRPSGGTGVSSPGSVSTPCIQRRLVTPAKAHE